VLFRSPLRRHMDIFWWKEKRLRTIWRVEKDGHNSFLVGTSHFCPYRFKKALTNIIQGVEVVLFEGPLDKKSMEKVVQYGRQGENTPSLYEALDPVAIKEINKELRTQWDANTTSSSYLELIQSTPSDFLKVHAQGVRPWMAFFTIWSALLNWKYSMDVEAFHIAQKLKKKIDYLETIEDQLAALDGIPFDRIVNYLNHIDHWKGYKELYLRSFSKGDLEKFASMTGEFPTRCDSIITKRDPIFFKRMKSFFEEGKTAVFVGVAHLPGVSKLFLNEGYRVYQEER
jgi:uncharacterized protein YbaP (TraB family)